LPFAPGRLPATCDSLIATLLEHRAQKWEPVLRKNDAATKAWSKMRDSQITHLALVSFRFRLNRNDIRKSSSAAIFRIAGCFHPA
jgi:hypothetical protein